MILTIIIGIFLYCWIKTIYDDHQHKEFRKRQYNVHRECDWCGRWYQIKWGSMRFCSRKCEKEHR